MDEERGFIDSIRNDPDNDAPRLIFADWLDEHDRGDQACFIRSQCELVTLRPLVVLEAARITHTYKDELSNKYMYDNIPSDLHYQMANIEGLLYIGYDGIKEEDIVDWAELYPSSYSKQCTEGVGFIKSIQTDVTYRSRGLLRIAITPMLETEGQHERRTELKRIITNYDQIKVLNFVNGWQSDADLPISYDYPKRGFVDKVCCTTEGWRMIGPTLIQRLPIQTVIFSDIKISGPFYAVYADSDKVYFHYFSELFGNPLKRYTNEKEAVEDVSKMAIEWAIKESNKE